MGLNLLREFTTVDKPLKLAITKDESGFKVMEKLYKKIVKSKALQMELEELKVVDLGDYKKKIEDLLKKHLDMYLYTTVIQKEYGVVKPDTYGNHKDYQVIELVEYIRGINVENKEDTLIHLEIIKFLNKIVLFGDNILYQFFTKFLNREDIEEELNIIEGKFWLVFLQRDLIKKQGMVNYPFQNVLLITTDKEMFKGCEKYFSLAYSTQPSYPLPKGVKKYVDNRGITYQQSLIGRRIFLEDLLITEKMLQLYNKEIGKTIIEDVENKLLELDKLELVKMYQHYIKSFTLTKEEKNEVGYDSKYNLYKSFFFQLKIVADKYQRYLDKDFEDVPYRSVVDLITYYTLYKYKYKEKVSENFDPYSELYRNEILKLDEIELSQQLMELYEKDQSKIIATAFETKKNITQKVQEIMDENDFLRGKLQQQGVFSYVELDDEIDIDIFGKLEQIYVSLQYTGLAIPKFKQREIKLRFRKLGKHHAIGIYSPSKDTIVIDPRNTKAFIHELGHAIDFNPYTKLGKEVVGLQRYDTILSMQEDFKEIRELYREGLAPLQLEKKAYYGTPTEIFARCFEVWYIAKMMQSTLIDEVYKLDFFESFMDNPAELLKLDQYRIIQPFYDKVEQYFDGKFLNKEGEIEWGL